MHIYWYTFDTNSACTGNQDHNIPDYFIRTHEELERRSRKRGMYELNSTYMCVCIKLRIRIYVYT